MDQINGTIFLIIGVMKLIYRIIIGYNPVISDGVYNLSLCYEMGREHTMATIITAYAQAGWERLKQSTISLLAWLHMLPYNNDHPLTDGAVHAYQRRQEGMKTYTPQTKIEPQSNVCSTIIPIIL